MSLLIIYTKIKIDKCLSDRESGGNGHAFFGVILSECSERKDEHSETMDGTTYETAQRAFIGFAQIKKKINHKTKKDKSAITFVLFNLYFLHTILFSYNSFLKYISLHIIPFQVFKSFSFTDQVSFFIIPQNLSWPNSRVIITCH